MRDVEASARYMSMDEIEGSNCSLNLRYFTGKSQAMPSLRIQVQV